MAAPYTVGDVVFLSAPAVALSDGTVVSARTTIAAEIIAHNAIHPSLFDLWADGVTFGPVNVTERGQDVLRASAPTWAVDAVDNGPWGNL